MKKKRNSFHAWLEEEMRDPEFRKAWDEDELPSKLAAEISCLRAKNNMTQAELARKIKTCQEVVSRLESAARPSVTLRTLQRIAAAFNKRLEIKFV